MTTPTEFRESFERQGAPAVRAFVEAGTSRGGVLDDGTLEAIRWLEEQEATERVASSAKRDAREEEALSIARKALATSDRANEISERANSDAEKARSIARRANNIAITAAILAAAATVIAAVIGVMYASPK